MIFFSEREILRQSSLHLRTTQGLSSPVSLNQRFHWVVWHGLSWSDPSSYCFSSDNSAVACYSPRAASDPVKTCEWCHVPALTCTCSATWHSHSPVLGFVASAVTIDTLLLAIIYFSRKLFCCPPTILSLISVIFIRHTEKNKRKKLEKNVKSYLCSKVKIKWWFCTV